MRNTCVAGTNEGERVRAYLEKLVKEKSIVQGSIGTDEGALQMLYLGNSVPEGQDSAFYSFLERIRSGRAGEIYVVSSPASEIYLRGKRLVFRGDNPGKHKFTIEKFYSSDNGYDFWDEKLKRVGL